MTILLDLFIIVFLAYTTAKAMKCSEIMAMVLGAFLCYPQIDALVQDVATVSTIFGLPVVKTAFTIGEQTRVLAGLEGSQQVSENTLLKDQATTAS